MPRTCAGHGAWGISPTHPAGPRATAEIVVVGSEAARWGGLVCLDVSESTHARGNFRQSIRPRTWPARQPRRCSVAPVCVRVMFDARMTLQQQVSEQLLEHFGDKVFKTIIPRNSHNWLEGIRSYLVIEQHHI